MLKATGRATWQAAAMSIPGGTALAAGGGHELRPRRAATLFIGAALACIATLALALAIAAPPAHRSHALPSRHALQGQRATRLPIGLAAAASARIGASEHGFWPVRHGASLLAQGGGIHSTFTASGAALRVARGTLGLSLSAVGRGHRVERVATGAPRGAASQILYRHGSISEFYRNGPYGLEQGFSLSQRPQAGTGPLVLTLGVGGSLIPRQIGSEIQFRTHSGAVALRYGQLSAQDATGRRLPAHMQVRNGTIQLQVDDTHARYPLRIDPFIQQGEKLTGSNDIGEGRFGYSVALSANGSTALIGGENDNGGIGAAWVFTRSGATWTQQGSKLTGSGMVGAGNFGESVALSGDGNTALIGGSQDNTFVGAAWVFTRSGSTWTQQGSKLTGSGEVGEGSFGVSVSLSSDGNTALIGGESDNTNIGAAWVFTRSGSTWTQQGSKFTGSGAKGEAHFGFAVALASEGGNTALIGGWNDNSEKGAAWVFTRSGSTWTQQGLKLTGSGEVGAGFFGGSVALSANGNTALMGGEKDNSFVGAAWVFTRSGSTWTQQGSKLTGSGEVGTGAFGESVSLSGDGNTALIGGESDNSRVGAAWLFTRSGSTWTQKGSKLTGGGEVGPIGIFGSSVALSTDANTALIGGYGDTSSTGAAWVFVNGPTVVTGAASSITQTSATVNATVNPNGQTVSDCHFEYGTTAAYGTSVPCTSLPGSGESPVGVSAPVAGLTANTTYHFRIVATNPGGTLAGSDQTFTTLPNPPALGTCAVSSITQTSATLCATVNPNGQTVSDCHFEYGTTEAYGTSVPCTSLPGSENSPVEVSAPITGLAANTTYHFRIVATNPGGTSKGSDRTFKTLPNPPTVVTEAASSETQTSVTLNATVNPNGGAVSDCHFEYGTSEAYGTSVPCVPLPGSENSPVPVSASVTGLTANTTYHFRISATNPGGTSKGSDRTFKTLHNPPTVVTEPASAITQTSVTLNATVNPNGAPVSDCHFEYGTTEAYGTSVACVSLPGSGESPVAVFASFPGLTANTTYHFRISATNPSGTSKGSDRTFKTLPNPPTVVAEAASSITQTSATLNATVNPNGGAVSDCHFEYGTTEAYGTSVPCVPLPGSENSPVPVSASVTGLTANTTYHFRIVATNPGGTSSGSDRAFTTLPTGPPPHYYSNNVLNSSEPRTLEAWGTVTLTNVKGGVAGSFITCHTADAGTIENPEGGGAGVGSTQVFATFDCESEGICPVGQTSALMAEKLPWPSVLTEEVVGTIKAESTGVKLFVECLAGEKIEGGQKFAIGASQKGLRPKFKKGTGAAHPSFLEYGEGSGELEKEGSGGTVTSKTEGSVKLQGYNAEEVPSAKNP